MGRRDTFILLMMTTILTARTATTTIGTTTSSVRTTTSTMRAAMLTVVTAVTSMTQRTLMTYRTTATARLTAGTTSKGSRLMSRRFRQRPSRMRVTALLSPRLSLSDPGALPENGQFATTTLSSVTLPWTCRSPRTILAASGALVYKFSTRALVLADAGPEHRLSRLWRPLFNFVAWQESVEVFVFVVA